MALTWRSQRVDAGRQVHLGVEKDFRRARKAHPAFLVGDLAELIRLGIGWNL